MLPLLLLGWRRGAFTVLALTVLPLTPQPAQAMDWGELWQREDQRAPKLIRENPADAASRLDDPEWRGSALYRSEQFEQAAEAFSAAEGARADYNRGNALARAGQLEQALAAYDQALEQDPGMTDARENRELVRQLLDQQQQQDQQQGQDQSQQSQQQQNGDSQNGSSDQSPGDQGQEQPQESGQSENSQDPGQPSEPSSNNGSNETDSNASDSQDNTGPEQQQQAQSGDGTDGSGQVEAPAQISEQPLSQGQEQWLRRVPDNPGGLLKRKFLQQYQERQTPSDEAIHHGKPASDLCHSRIGSDGDGHLSPRRGTQGRTRPHSAL